MVAIAVVGSLAAARASAQAPPSMLRRADSAGAGPSAAATQIGWLEGLHARVGLDLPVYDAPGADGFRIALAPFVELYDRESYNAFPYQYWRGSLAIRSGYRARVWGEGEERGTLAIDVVFAHESDHETVHLITGGVGVGRYATFLFTNALGVRGTLATTFSFMSVVVSAQLDVHVASCTNVSDDCSLRVGEREQSVGLSLDAVLRSGAEDDAANVQICGAVHGGYIAGVDRVIEELRLTAQAGPCIRWLGGGEWSLLGMLHLGSQTGMHRAVREVTAGGALRWAL